MGNCQYRILCVCLILEYEDSQCLAAVCTSSIGPTRLREHGYSIGTSTRTVPIVVCCLNVLEGTLFTPADL
ncbi:hypothetical protein B0I72DRAFT_139110 [Yarrowia lipolytica]|uniref:Uncharacterized protein n=1 Tax=Yarrowia lipolytica TaxID=4952 RepID=A0A371BY62_YARLL|nr:hypothetical protein BKA91DRAFT_135350 [Yarrowia lipolytica]KAE8172601.1 hypothetical protein BKA90DRAFT_136920 [Yarrowia lipolytica]RDW23029.1 hypothetical protein B0I71DRAFT_136610 [Yarrowia lipolytica]RDW31806.1 hypothetical protein B0I72DRAFT_139110 [Yarrowia lipolytica]RDW36545.1 hypothetical protein B0I73DRAFT_136940 [Yarrowia lipolytica]